MLVSVYLPVWGVLEYPLQSRGDATVDVVGRAVVLEVSQLLLDGSGAGE